MTPNRTFGKLVRDERERRGIGLRQFARQVGMSPTYLSKVERGEFAPPAEEKVVAIAGLLELDADNLLGLAGKVAKDLQQIIRRRPSEMASFLRSVNGLSAEQMAQLAREAARRRQEP